jgi:uncharacterized membrane protein
VAKVQDRLDLYEQAGDIPGLQGHSTRTGQRANWTPAGRALASAAGSALTIYGLRTRGLAGSATGLLGAGLLVRAITGMNLKRLTGVGAGPRAVDVRKTLHINAPVQEVFRLWTDYENFPRFMSHIRDVRDHGDGRSHWVAEGPAGTSVSWDAEITGFEPDRMLAWKSVPGSMVENSGIVRFEATSNGACRIHLRISYNPPAGAAGHALAWMFGRDLKTQLDEDLVRLKSLIEDGKTRSAAGEPVSRSELESGWEPQSLRRF